MQSEVANYNEDREFQALRDEVCTLTSDLTNYRVGMVAGVVALLAAGFACVGNGAPFLGAVVCSCAYLVVFLMYCVIYDRLRGINRLGAYLLVFHETPLTVCAQIAFGDFSQDTRCLHWEARSRIVRHRVGYAFRYNSVIERLCEELTHGGCKHIECVCLIMISLAALFCLAKMAELGVSVVVVGLVATMGLVLGLLGFLFGERWKSYREKERLNRAAEARPCFLVLPTADP